MKKYFFSIFTLLVLALSCVSSYKAGNLVDLGYPIDTRLRTKIIRQYVDTLIAKHGFSVPDKWQKLDKLVDLDSINYKRLYFKEEPEELYLISFSGMLVLSDVYNPKIIQGSWIAEESAMPKEERKRILNRFHSEVLNVIEKLALRDHLTDSSIYKY